MMSINVEKDRIENSDKRVMTFITKTQELAEDESRKQLKNRKFQSESQEVERFSCTRDTTESSLKLLKFLADSQFSLTQVNGQRKLGPPPGWTGPPPGLTCEIFVGSIPRNYYEPEIVLIFSSVGQIYELRLMMEFSGLNRGYCFIMYTTPQEATRAVKELDQFEIYPGKRIGVVASINNCRLYMKQFSKNIESEAIVKRMYEITEDVDNVAIYRNFSNEIHYVLVSYKTHRGAAMARKRLVPVAAMLFENCSVNVEWANPNITPSNIFEEIGTCDEYGNVELKKLFIETVVMKKSVTRFRYQKTINKRLNLINQREHKPIDLMIEKARVIKVAPQSLQKNLDYLSNHCNREAYQSKDQYLRCNVVDCTKNICEKDLCQSWDINGNLKNTLDHSVLHENSKTYEQQDETDMILPSIRTYLNIKKCQRSSKWIYPEKHFETFKDPSDVKMFPDNLPNVSYNQLNKRNLDSSFKYKLHVSSFDTEKLQSNVYPIEKSTWNSVDNLAPKFSSLFNMSNETNANNSRYEHVNLHKKEQQIEQNIKNLTCSVPCASNDSNRQVESCFRYANYYQNFAIIDKCNSAGTYVLYADRPDHCNGQTARNPQLYQDLNRENVPQQAQFRPLVLGQNFGWCFAGSVPKQTCDSDLKSINGIASNDVRLNNHMINGSPNIPEVLYYNKVNNGTLSSNSVLNIDRFAHGSQPNMKRYARPILKAGNANIRVNY